jgi:7-cyano-7-deazaguanine synthase
MSAALLLSGGTDSVALAYWKRPTIAYTVDYGQLPAVGEIRAAAAVCDALGIRHRVLRVNCGELGSG